MAMGGQQDERRPMADINVTPLVDVMLVLLVIFMVTAPMMQQGVQVNLPKANTKAMTPQDEAVVVSVDKSGKVFINKDEIPAADLRNRLTAMFASREKKEVFLKADAGVPYGEVVKAMADIKGAGIERLGKLLEFLVDGDPQRLECPGCHVPVASRGCGHGALDGRRQLGGACRLGREDGPGDRAREPALAVLEEPLVGDPSLAAPKEPSERDELKNELAELEEKAAKVLLSAEAAAACTGVLGLCDISLIENICLFLYAIYMFERLWRCVDPPLGRAGMKGAIRHDRSDIR